MKTTLYLNSVCAGFPSPASDYLEGEIDLNRYLIKNPPATFIVKSQGNCMLQAGIHSGDLLVVDRSIKPKNNSIVIASIDGELTVKRIKISGKNYEPKLHSIECRINAEDPANGFRPSPGTITTFHAPGGHGVRLDTHVYAGYSIPPFYDSMIAKLITTAQTREEAIDKMRRALDEFVIEGVKTTIPFHRALMDDPNYLAGNYTTKFMEDFKYEEQ